MVKHLILRFCGNERGATAVEYGLLLGLMVLALIGGLTAVGTATSGNFNAAVEGFPDA